MIDDPERSNRQIGEALGVDHKTVATVRAEAESTGEIPQFATTTGKDGKSRPAKRKPPPDTLIEARAKMRLADELDALDGHRPKGRPKKRSRPERFYRR